ncbi:cdc42 effector protein 1 [Thalassophryne amazonica]|uniref:cdc42 effector protein 1 n=1 Tax=Thalassophryne amazonica TaxID=390379 RepID=UPI0014719DE5|nr:cdc42 effector protein 1 [Thalassophryne amazonica]
MNLQEKLSGLKGLVSHSHSKRRFRGDLTVDMISPPLGDFRHTMHVGRGGDVFGDTSFLSNHGGTTNGTANGETDAGSTPDNKIGAFFSRTLRQIRRTSDNQPRGGSKDLSPPPPAVSPIIKNAISLPRLDLDMSNGSPTTRKLFPSFQSTPEDMRSAYGPESGFVTLPRLSRSERQQPSVSVSTNVHRGSLTDPTDAILSTCSTSIVTSDPIITTTTYSDSLPSLTSLDTFTFDLGPSLMSEVFGLIDGHMLAEEEAGSACGLTNEGSEMDSATISYVDSLLREEEEGSAMETAGGGHHIKGGVTEVVTGSPVRARIVMHSATEVFVGHYGDGSLLKGQNLMEDPDSELDKVSHGYIEDEDEIKV